ncbi:MAG: hypothetical protein IAF58_04850 [Leptolyngbya sp.]|nr:hypothetical protein [Candidatus Melainabacteria bacterium]
MKAASNALFIMFMIMAIFSPVSRAEDTPERAVKLPAFLEIIRSAKQLEDARIPASAEKSQTRKAYEEASQAGKRVQNDLEWLIHNAEPPGRLYAAALIKRFDAQRGKEAFEDLKSDKDSVSYKQGGEVVHYSVGEIAIDLLSPHPNIVIDKQ